MKLSNIIILLIIIGSFTFYNYKAYIWPSSPCSKPIEFSIGTVDPRFGLSKSDLIKKVEQAGDVWNKAENKNLFQYSETGALKINFIYDSRQQMTDDLKKQGVTIDDDKAIYNSLKSKFNSAVTTYNSQKVAYEKALADFEVRQQSYNDKVDYFNSHGGVPKKDYTSLSKEKEVLDNMLIAVNNLRDKVNSQSKQVNQYAQMLNTLAEKLNIKVADYNNIGGANGDEFSEGEYIRDSLGEIINIYQFENNTQMVRVLAHELGHALGLEHVGDSQAIMYNLNISKNISLTAADMAEIDFVCGN